MNSRGRIMPLHLRERRTKRKLSIESAKSAAATGVEVKRPRGFHDGPIGRKGERTGGDTE